MHFIHTKTSLQMRIIEREQRTAEQMIRIYCRYKEGNKELCPTCQQLLHYAHNRLEHCTFGEQKKTCRNCPIHCYKPEMKKRIQEVMRYAGPRMFFFHPITTIKHFKRNPLRQCFYLRKNSTTYR